MECAGGSVDAEGGSEVTIFTTEAQRHGERPTFENEFAFLRVSVTLW